MNTSLSADRVYVKSVGEIVCEIPFSAAKTMVTEGASVPPHSVQTTVSPILYEYHEAKPTETTKEQKEQEKDQRKDDTFLPAINNFHASAWYPFYVVNTSANKNASKLMRRHPTTTASRSTVIEPSMVPDPTVTDLTTVPDPSQHPPDETESTVTSTMTELTMSQHTLTEVTLNQFKMMTLEKLFPHYSHPPYYSETM